MPYNSKLRQRCLKFLPPDPKLLRSKSLYHISHRKINCFMTSTGMWILLHINDFPSQVINFSSITLHSIKVQLISYFLLSDLVFPQATEIYFTEPHLRNIFTWEDNCCKLFLIYIFNFILSYMTPNATVKYWISSIPPSPTPILWEH